MPLKTSRKKELRSEGIFCGILDKASRNTPLSSSQKKRNYKLSKARAIVEHPIQVYKFQWNYRKTRYRSSGKMWASKICCLEFTTCFEFGKS
jgi:IS5 family transposase